MVCSRVHTSLLIQCQWCVFPPFPSPICLISFSFDSIFKLLDFKKMLKTCDKCDKSDKKFIRYLIKSEICWEEKCHHRHACNNMSIQSVRVGFIFQVIKKMN